MIPKLSTLLFTALITLFTACGGAYHESTPTPVPDQFKVVGQMVTPRIWHTATKLKTGKVLIVGGWTGEHEVGEIELYDPATQKFRVVGAMKPLMCHASILLSDGNVLVTGGSSDSWMSSEAFIIDTVTFHVESIGFMNSFRTDHTMTEFPDHTILVVGGGYADDAQAELFNPYSRRFTVVGSNANYRRGHAAVLMDTNHVFVTGGYMDNSLESAEVFSRWDNAFGVAPAMIRDQLSQQATKLKDGRILLTGFGEKVRIFSPETGYTEDLQNMLAPRQYHTATLLDDERVLIVGTYDFAQKCTEVYSLMNGGDASVQPSIWRSLHQATKLDDGTVLMTGGNHYKSNDTVEITATAELFIPGHK